MVDKKFKSRIWFI